MDSIGPEWLERPVETFSIKITMKINNPVVPIFIGVLNHPHVDGTPYVLLLPKSIEETLYRGQSRIIFVNDDVLEKATAVEGMVPPPRRRR